jgi:hypothetical protein
MQACNYRFAHVAKPKKAAPVRKRLQKQTAMKRNVLFRYLNFLYRCPVNGMYLHNVNSVLQV